MNHPKVNSPVWAYGGLLFSIMIVGYLFSVLHFSPLYEYTIMCLTNLDVI